MSDPVIAAALAGFVFVSTPPTLPGWCRKVVGSGSAPRSISEKPRATRMLVMLARRAAEIGAVRLGCANVVGVCRWS
jgi:hypothetical protein